MMARRNIKQHKENCKLSPPRKFKHYSLILPKMIAMKHVLSYTLYHVKFVLSYHCNDIWVGLYCHFEATKPNPGPYPKHLPFSSPLRQFMVTIELFLQSVRLKCCMRWHCSPWEYPESNNYFGKIKEFILWFYYRSPLRLIYRQCTRVTRRL